LGTITTDGHLKKPSVRQVRGQALVVLTMIRVLAFTLSMVFFHRQVRSPFRTCSIGFCALAGVSICCYSSAGFQLNPS
jgi:hypothetical protein